VYDACVASRGVLVILGAGLLLMGGIPEAVAQRAQFVAPPRTIADITAILDQEKPDPAKRAKVEADAGAEPPAHAEAGSLKDFYFRRAQARASVGRLKDAIADCEKAIAKTSDYAGEGSRIELYQESQMRLNGDHKEAVALLERMAQRLNVSQPPNKGRAFGINSRTANNLLQLGQVNKAESYVKRNVALLSEARSWPNAQQYLSSFEASTEDARGRLLLARGQYAEAEAAYSKAEAKYRDALVKSRSWPNAVPAATFESAIDYATLFTGRAKAMQGRHAEAEIDMRRALLSRLKSVGKYHADTTNMLTFLSELLFEQARLKESEALARASIEVLDAIGYGRDSGAYVNALGKLASAVFQLRRYDEAKEIYLVIDASTQAWPPERSAFARSSWARIYTHYFTREVDKGIEYARQALDRQKAVKGEKHYDTALTRAILATGLTFARRDAEAMRDFMLAIPVLLGRTNEADDEDATVTVSADRRLQTVLEAYITLLARSNHPTRAEEGLRMSEAIRGRSVQNALASSAARAAARTPEMAEIVRKEQDLHKQAVAQATLLSNVLAEPPEERDPNAVRALEEELARLRKDKQGARREIQRRFPEYASLIRPAPTTVDDIRASLRADEALLSFYFGNRESFVWAIPKDGPVAFARLALNATQLQSKVTALRAALDPPALESVADIPNFDVEGAHELYKLLLQPVAPGWRDAKTLIVVTNGALGLLPLSLLPTEPAKVTAKLEGEPYFTAYRNVQWLARTHAVVAMPSAGALRTLRNVAAPSMQREQIVGFGDPYFSVEQATEARSAERVSIAAEAMRGARVKRRASIGTGQLRSTSLGALPRLEDTGDELKAIASALQADPSKVLYLGKDANEKVVKSIDLTRYRVVVFATHGLVPGDLDGLTQPALALTAPEVADIDGDGLLTVDEILALRLNAEWVVLSACNTAAGAGQGAEALSGLGRAFFYAGSRALLVTNWPVDSASARELVTGVFRRQAENPQLSRAELLRQSMLAVLESSERKNEAGETIYTYAHPLFWAPYSIMGDGS
jgi:CHAT domain-containing protein/tetratricopeptide (TPR) repeat protein